MHDMTSVSMICADTTRSRAYLQNLARAGLRPARVLVLAKPGSNLPGQAREKLPAAPGHADRDTLWQRAHFDPNNTLSQDIRALGAPVDQMETTDINDPQVVDAVAGLPGDTVIYSGFGGQILRAAVLDTGKQFLHVHGGYLPDFRGSTTNYFSLIAENALGASAIFLTAKIDAGPVLMRQRFAAPPDRTQIDHLHDSAARSVVLCDVLRAFVDTGTWPRAGVTDDMEATTYYVVHPVLKHLAIYPSTKSGTS